MVICKGNSCFSDFMAAGTAPLALFTYGDYYMSELALSENRQSD